MQTKENTHTHTQQYRKKILPTHTHQNTLSKTYKKPNNNAKNYIQTIYQREDKASNNTAQHSK
jgi:hypothetical protein